MNCASVFLKPWIHFGKEPALQRLALDAVTATRNRWALHTKQVAAQRDQRRAELERKAKEDSGRVAKMDEGNGRGLGRSLP